MVHKIAFSPTDDILASCSTDQTVRLWDTHTGDCINIFEGHDAQVRYLAFSPDGKLLASNGIGGKEIKIWDIHNSRCINTLRHKTSVWSIAFSLDGKFITSGTEKIQLWDLVTGKCFKILPGHERSVRALDFDFRGRLISCEEDGSIKIWNTNSGNCLTTIRVNRPYEGLNITGVTGLTKMQRNTLKKLGAIEKSDRDGPK